MESNGAMNGNNNSDSRDMIINKEDDSNSESNASKRTIDAT